MELDLNEKQTNLRQKRLELKEIQMKLTKERVAKFAKLVGMTFNAKTAATDEEKYSNLKKLAKCLRQLLGEKGRVEGDDDLATFKDFEKFKTLMNTYDPHKVKAEMMADIQKELENIQDPFHADPKATTGSSTEFKKTFKYKELFNWAMKFMEVAKAS